MAEEKIFGAIIKVMQEVAPIAKGRTNTQQNYKFRGVDELMNQISPILSKHSIFPTTFAIENVLIEAVTSKNGGGGTHLIRRYTFRFYAEDGSSVDTIADGEAIDYGDKASNKAQSVAYREAMFKMFVIPFEGEDIENDSHDLAARPATPTAPAKAPGSNKLVPPKTVTTLQKKKRIMELCDAKALNPLDGAEDYATYVLGNTGLDLVEENFDTIITRLEALQ